MSYTETITLKGTDLWNNDGIEVEVEFEVTDIGWDNASFSHEFGVSRYSDHIDHFVIDDVRINDIPCNDDNTIYEIEERLYDSDFINTLTADCKREAEIARAEEKMDW